MEKDENSYCNVDSPFRKRQLSRKYLSQTQCDTRFCVVKFNKIITSKHHLSKIDTSVSHETSSVGPEHAGPESINVPYDSN